MLRVIPGRQGETMNDNKPQCFLCKGSIDASKGYVRWSEPEPESVVTRILEQRRLRWAHLECASRFPRMLKRLKARHTDFVMYYKFD